MATKPAMLVMVVMVQDAMVVVVMVATCRHRRSAARRRTNGAWASGLTRDVSDAAGAATQPGPAQR